MRSSSGEQDTRSSRSVEPVVANHVSISLFAHVEPAVSRSRTTTSTRLATNGSMARASGSPAFSAKRSMKIRRSHCGRCRLPNSISAARTRTAACSARSPQHDRKTSCSQASTELGCPPPLRSTPTPSAFRGPTRDYTTHSRKHRRGMPVLIWWDIRGALFRPRPLSLGEPVAPVPPAGRTLPEVDSAA